MNRAFLSTMFLALGMVFAGSAHAQCGAVAIKPMALFRPGSLPSPEALTAMANPNDASEANKDMVGLWHAKYTQNGQLFDEGYDAFHSDGLEILNDGPTLCLGIWKKTGARTFKLHHVFWNWDANGVINGSGVWDTEITLDKSGDSYTGTWKIQNFDLNGHPISLPFGGTGTVAATRINVE